LIDRAKGTGADQGQWSDSKFIVEAEQLAPLQPGGHTVLMQKPIGKVFTPNGGVIENVDRAIVVRQNDLSVRTSYPIVGGSK
jgi:hypothetical protein